MNENVNYVPSSYNAMQLFVVLSYGLSIALFTFWRVYLKVRSKKLSIPADSTLFNVIMTSSMFIPLLSLYLLSLAYGQPQGFIGFVSKWLRISPKSLLMFLLAPFPPIVALIIYMEAMRAMDMIRVDALKQITGLDGFASAKALKILSMGYIAGVTINALLAACEEFGWRAYLMFSLAKYIGTSMSTVIVGTIWGLWHAPVIFSLKPLIEKNFPWMTLRLALTNNVVSCTILSYPLYLLLISSDSILPPASFHGTVNALWAIPQFVTKVSDERKYRDIVKVALVSLFAWGVAIIITVDIGEVTLAL